MQENYPRLSAAAAGDRKYDVYMGIDVFGRNTYGGGQWKVCNILVSPHALFFPPRAISFWMLTVF